MDLELRDQGWYIYCPRSRVLCQFHEVIIVISQCHGALLEPLKLISKCLSVVNIEIVINEQPLKYIPRHGAGVVVEPNSLPPSMVGPYSL